MSGERLRVCAASELRHGHVLSVPIGDDPVGRPQSALLLRDEDGQVRAYLNRCRHLPIPLDAGGQRFLSDDRRHLVCVTHGAAYRLRDGACQRGPCAGQSLIALPVEERAGVVLLTIP